AQSINPPVDYAYETPGHETDYEESFEIGGAAAAPPRSETAPIASGYPAELTGSSRENTGRNNRNDRNERGDRNRAGRDRNDRNRGRGDRGGNRESRVPRGFAPKTALYGVEDTPADSESAESAIAPDP